MTRGTLYVVTDKEVISSTEFNGDAYSSGYGIFYIEMLEKIKTVDDFKKIIKAFNDINFHYEGKIIYKANRKNYFNKKGLMDMNGIGKKNYFDLYFSDWIFIKNLTDKPFGIKTRESDGNGKGATPELVILHPNEQVALNFGSNEGNFKSVQECCDANNLKKGDGSVGASDKKIIFDSIGASVEA